MCEIGLRNVSSYQSIEPNSSELICSEENYNQSIVSEETENLNYTPVDDQYTCQEKSYSGNASSQVSFIEENGVCIEPEYKEGAVNQSVMTYESSQLMSIDPEELFNRPKVETSINQDMCIDPTVVDINNKHIDPSTFTSDLEKSNIVMDMDLQITDQNGFNNFAKNDVNGFISKGHIDVNKDLFSDAINSLKGYKSSNGDRDTTIHDVRFDSNEKAYVIDVEVEQKILWKAKVWDNFQIKIKVDDNGQLIAKPEKNWIFDSMILDNLEGLVKNKIKEKIPEKFNNFDVNIQKKDDRLVIIPEIHDLTVPITAQSSLTVDKVNAENANFELDSSGNFHIDLKGITFNGSSSDKEVDFSSEEGKSDIAYVNLKVGLDKDKSKQVYARGNLLIDLDKNETSSVQMKGESLSNYFESGEVLNDFSLYVHHQLDETPQVKTNNYVYIKDAKIGNQTVDLMTDLKLNFDSKRGILLEAKSNMEEKPLEINPTENGVELFVNGTEYLPEMEKMISSAKETINIETYQFHNDEAGQRVAYMMAKKAAGLDSSIENVNLSKDSKDGVKVKIIFNSKNGSLEDGKHSEELMQTTIEKVYDEIQNSNLSKPEKDKAVENLNKNFKWKFFSEGILRSDHRKVFVIDGEQATVGGMNVGKQYLMEGGYHDTMLKVAGPEVRNIHKEFLENWFEFNNLQMPNDKEWDLLLKSQDQLKTRLRELQSENKYSGTSNIQTLATDDNKKEIEQGILKMIDEAQEEINIEQAFFSHSDITDSLKRAVKRGVKVNVIVAKHSLVDIFDKANLDTVYQLIKTQDRKGYEGGINLYYFDNPNGGDSKHIHTKAISVDGKKAIIGSANMIGRSLDSPFTKIDKNGNKSQTLYNKELSLYVEDTNMVNQINSRIFHYDMVHNSKAMSPQEIRELVEKYGGESELRKSALIAKLT